jgi:dTDP-glucose 4,6-dehydratase
VSRIVVTGGAGFVGSHLCEALLARGDEVICVDNLSTGRRSNVEGMIADDGFRLVVADVAAGPGVAGGLAVDGPVDGVLHLASPASPADYLRLPLETLAVGSVGTTAAIELARRHDARFVMASTSEVYGEPLNHPQVEEDWGNVNSVGPRSVYDEAKRFSEALTMAYHRTHGVRTGIVRIFNTYGPRLRAGDGRVVSNFVVAALAGDPLTVYGDGCQTRSFCYVDDLVRGLVAMLDSEETGPVNLGNPNETTVAGLAELVIELTASSSRLSHQPLPLDDPTRRRPEIAKASATLGWAPEVSLGDGLRRTIAWFAPERNENTTRSGAATGGREKPVHP